MAACGYGFSTRAITRVSVLCGTRVSGEVTSLQRNWQSVAPLRGNTFADEMASGAATSVEALPSWVNAVKAIDGMAWQVRVCIVEVVRLTLSFKGPLCGLILFFFDLFQQFPFSTVSRAEGGGGLLAGAATSSRRQKPRGLSTIWVN